jgi:hypothetical protein
VTQHTRECRRVDCRADRVRTFRPMRTDSDEATNWDTIADWSGYDVRTLLA